MRPEIERLVKLGPFPPEPMASIEYLREAEKLILAITKPMTNQETRALVTLFGPPDSCYGLAWSVLHLIESAPDWPIVDCIEHPNNEWVATLRDRAVRGGLL